MKASATSLQLLALFFTSVAALEACAQESAGNDDDDDDVNAEQSADELSKGGLDFSLRCKGSDGASVTVVVSDKGATFDLNAKPSNDPTAAGTTLFEASAQRPSLNARIEDGTSSTINEYVDFNDNGLETVPVDGPKAIEVDLGGAKAFLFKDATKTVQLTSCRFDKAKLARFLKLNMVTKPPADITAAGEGVKAVGFDIDDTLAFTTPTFVRAFATGGTPKPEDVLFWTHTNGCDSGCNAETITLPDGSTKLLPANAPSTPKSKALQLIQFHKAHGHRVYAITARPDTNGDPLRDYLETQLGIDKKDVYFEPDMDLPGNPKGKTDRIESLNLDLFYGDSDSDITDTAKAFVNPTTGARTKEVRAIRFERSPKSSNRKAGKLNKYHPGYYGEPVIKDSYE